MGFRFIFHLDAQQEPGEDRNRSNDDGLSKENSVTAMSRLGIVLLMLLMTWPMVRDCCLPVTHNLPCHESKPKPTDASTCFSTQEAIAETKSAPAKAVRNVIPRVDAADIASGIGPDFLSIFHHQLSKGTDHAPPDRPGGDPLVLRI